MLMCIPGMGMPPFLGGGPPGPGGPPPFNGDGVFMPPGGGPPNGFPPLGPPPQHNPSDAPSANLGPGGIHPDRMRMMGGGR